MEKYEKDGKIAVLISVGYGAGWSTWNQPELAYDKRVVEFWMENRDKILTKDEIQNALKKMGYYGVYIGGYHQIRAVWVPKGTKYFIDEYDGYESIKYVDSYDWQEA